MIKQTWMNEQNWIKKQRNKHGGMNENNHIMNKTNMNEWIKIKMNKNKEIQTIIKFKCMNELKIIKQTWTKMY